MDREKQIEEMCETIASMICEVYNPLCDENKPHTCSRCYANSTKIGDFAEMLYNAGYRKQSEVAEKIFDEIEKLVSTNKKTVGCATYEETIFYIEDFIEDLAELKKKYTGEKEDADA